MDLLKFIKTQKIILLDGAMGSQLIKRGSEAGVSNITNPDMVLEIHRGYAQCDCHALIANTLTMNRIYIETHNLDIGVREVNIAGVELAKQVAGENQYVLGNLSSTGQMLEPYGTYKESDFYENFKEQAGILAEGSVDGFIIETMFDLREALCALRACKAVASLPVIVSMAFSTSEKGGRTIMGNTVEQIAKAVTDAGAEAVGANCGELSPAEMSVVISHFSTATSIPIIAEPNAGKPRLVAGKTQFDMDPDTFAEGIALCVESGARIVGGCCGTTPEHICETSARIGIL
jgi:5-methyltetrahydrofolate--homocysteine methyltransferase